MGLNSIEEAIEAIAQGKYVVVVDDADRENEGDLIIAAEYMTGDKMSFLLTHSSGVVCVPMTGQRLDALDLPLMCAKNTESMRTAFTITVDVVEGTSTGISAHDRALTVRALGSLETTSEMLCRPGHVFPLRAKEGGVLKRAGHTEAALDLMKLAGLAPVGVLCEIVNPDGSMARLPALEKFSKKHDLVLISVADLVRYRRAREKLVTQVSKARLPTPYGEFTAYAYESTIDGIQHMALVKGEVGDNVLVRVHSECLTGDIFGSRRCDCGAQLQGALARIAAEGSGIVVYLRGQEGRGIGLGHKLRAYCLQDEGFDTVEANLELGLPIDSREYGIGAQILADLNVSSLRLLTNNPKKYTGLSGYGLEIVERIPLLSLPNKDNVAYLKTKRDKMGHYLDMELLNAAT